MAGLSLTQAQSPPDDLVSPPDDLVDAAPAPSEKPSGAAAVTHGLARGALPAAGGLGAGAIGAQAGAAVGALTGPLAPIAIPVLAVAGGLYGGYKGAQATEYLQDKALSAAPESVRRGLGQTDEQRKADTEAHPYLSMAGEIAPNLLFMRPGRVASAVPEGAGILRRSLASPVASHVIGGGLGAAQEAGTEKYQTGEVDPWKVVMAGAAGATMNKPTRAGEAVISAATMPVQALTNIAMGRRPAAAPPPRTEPTAAPPADLMPEASIPRAAAPPGAPAPGEPVGVRFKAGPPRRGTVDHYFDSGNAARIQWDDGTFHDITTADLLAHRTEPPAPVPEKPAPTRPSQQLGMDERPLPPLDLLDPGEPAPPRRAAPTSQPVLGDEMLRALDHADGLERTALDQSLRLTAQSRQDMLAESGRLRRLYGHAEDEGTPPNAYRHPLADEPAADLGELAQARAAKPELYEGPRKVPPPDLAPARETTSPDELYAMQDVTRARAPLPKEPTVFDAIRELGGIRDDRGDVRQILKDYKNERFKKRVLNPQALPPDRIREALQEQGWFGSFDDQFGHSAMETGSYPGDSLRDLYDLMDREARGEKVYHPESEIHGELQGRRHLEEEMTEAGVVAADKPEEAARKLAAYRRERDAGQADAAQPIHDTLNDLPPDDMERLASHGYEPGSDIGAEHEEFGGDEEGAPRPEDFRAEPEEDHGSGQPPADRGEGPAEGDTVERGDGGEGVTKFQQQPPNDLFSVEPGATDAQDRPLDQTIIPGAEHLSEAEMQRRALEQRMQAHKQGKAGQKTTHGFGLFDPEAALAKPTEEPTLFQQDAARDQTETPEFQRWFKGSKVVDENGRPMRVYHGTGAEFEVFQKPAENRMSMRAAVGFWFTTDKADAQSYGGKLVEAYLSIRKPRRITRRALDDMAQTHPLPALLENLRKGGHDGLLVEAIKPDRALAEPGMPQQWVAFDPTQIKSATGNRGTFDPNDARINYQRDDGVAPTAKGEMVKLADDLLGETIKNPSPEEARLLNEIEKVAERIVPSTKVRTMRRLVGGPDAAAKVEGFSGGRITGATYSNGLRRVIAASLESPDVVGTIKHEALHYLRGRGLITNKEWAALEKATAKDGWIAKHDIENRYPNASEVLHREEAIAEEFSKWRKAPDSVPQMFRPLYERVSKFLARVADAARKVFGKDVTADDVMSRMDRGEMDRRDAAAPERQEPTFQQDAPQNMTQAGDRLDKVSDDLADTLKGAPPGTYERELRRMAPPSGPAEFKGANVIEKNMSLFPHMLAKLDTLSGKFWDQWKEREGTYNRLMSDARDIIAPTFLKLDDKARARIYAAEELDRLNSTPREETGHSVVVRNEKNQHAQFSKPGDVITLTPEETKAYHERRAMFQKQWDNIMEGTARRLGWNREWGPDVGQNLEAMKAAAESAHSRGERRSIERARDVVAAMAEQRKDAYVPLMRFGDYFISVKPKTGTDMSSTGGFPKTEWFELVEPPATQNWLGSRHRTGETPKHAQARIAALQTKFPADRYNVEHGYLFKRADVLRQLDIPAVEKLMTVMEGGVLRSLYDDEKARGLSKPDAKVSAKAKYDDLFGQMIEQLRDQMYEEMKAGFKKRSHTVPGYSPDFDRTTGAYMHWTGRHVADQIHRERIDQTYDNIQTQHPSQATKQYWKDWRDYQERPRDALSRAGDAASRIGFIYTLAGNISSAVVNATDPIISTIPALSTGVGMKTAGKAYGSALKHSTMAMRADTERGLHVDPVRAARTPDERAMLAAMDRDGLLNPKWTEEMEALNQRQSAMWGNLKAQTRRMLDIASSTMGSTEQIKRVATALAAYRMAKEPKTLAAMDKAWGKNQVWRAMRERDGVNPENMARFMTSEGAFEWGRANQAPAMRGPIGQATFLLHGFQTRWLSQAWNLMNNMGPDGKRALLWMAAGVWLGSGIEGLPFAQDAENLADLTWKFFTGKDPMIQHRIRAMMADSGFGKVGSEIVMRGPTSTVLGADISSRIGFGDILSRQFSMDTAGGLPLTVWSIAAGRAAAVQRKLASHQPASAAAELLPSALRNPAIAAIESQKGVKSQSGNMVIPPGKVTPVETSARALGFNPLKVSRAQQESDYRYRAQRAKMRPPKSAIPK